ncbi:hypothetical protein BD289DRAFT_339004, partial [Coniella lustricola]
KMQTKFIAGLAASASVASGASVRQLYQGNGSTTWLENLRVRSNGNVLVTEIGPPANLLTFDPTQADPEAVVIQTFPSILGLSGITEVKPDVFVITGANTTGSNIADPPLNATKVWLVDFNQGQGNEPLIELIGEPVLPQVTDYNGLTTFNETIILASATFQDTVVAMDITTGAYWTVFDDPLMASINGIKASDDGYLYWTANSGLVRAPLYEDLTLGTAETVYEGSYDDFAVSDRGFALSVNGTRYAYMASNEDAVQQIIFDDATGNVSSAAFIAQTTNATEWGKGTACDFGRADWQKNKVYCTTGGS